MRHIGGHAEAGNSQLIQVAGSLANGFVYVSPGPAGGDVPGSEAFVSRSVVGSPAVGSPIRTGLVSEVGVPGPAAFCRASTMRW